MIILLGANGQLGSDIAKELKINKKSFKILNRNDLDLSNVESLKILESFEFDYLINSTGYHKTDEVEDNADLAFLVNSFSVRELAKICEKKNATLIHFSTDYVFGGVQHSEPISEEGITSPLNIYGSSKLMGENLIRHELESHFICRVSSLFGEAGSSGKGGNFVEAIINKAKKNEKISVVGDQIMTPTSTKSIANYVINLINEDIQFGTYNLVNDGEMSWFDFASLILENLDFQNKIEEIQSKDLNLKALRPSYSALSTSKIKNIGLSVSSSRSALTEYLKRKGHIG